MTSPSTIPEALLDTAQRGRGRFVFHLDDGPVEVSCEELAERAERGARRLLALGVEPGDAVGVLGPNRPEWTVWAFATWIAGAVLVPVQLPLRIRDPDAFRNQVRGLVEAAGCRRVMAEGRFATLLPETIAVPWEEDGDTSREPHPAPGPGSAAVIQFTSGSTAAPKGALLSHAAISAQMEVLHGYRYEDGSPRDTLSWTPFFHDLGLFANVVRTAYTGCTSHHLPTERFAGDPALWLRLLEATRAPVTVGPSSAFGSALRAARRRGERIDLSALEAAYFAAEGVDPEVSRQMAETARAFGFQPEALGATYGLAEAVMAVSYPYAGTGLHIDRIGLDELLADGVAAPASDGRIRLVASAGKPHMDVRIVSSEGSLGERRVGEIQVRGASMMSGYIGDAVDPFDGEWLCTGDLGYLAGGDLYVTGRAKDMVIAMGQNYYPEDFEWAASRTPGVRAGRCTAFAEPGTERVVLLVEPSDADADPAQLRREVARSVRDAVGVARCEVIVLPRGAVEKTTSGKLRRARMRDSYTKGGLPALAAPGSAKNGRG